MIILPQKTLYFLFLFSATAQDDDNTVYIGLGGDLLYSKEMMDYAFSQPNTYQTFAQEIKPLFRSPFVDMFYFNHETPTAAGMNNDWEDVKDPGLKTGEVYGFTHPENIINNNPILAPDLVKLVDHEGKLSEHSAAVVSLVNNHAMDRGPKGVKKTIDVLDRAGLPHFGTRVSSNTSWYTEGAGYVVKAKNGIQIAFTGCTSYINRHMYERLGNGDELGTQDDSKENILLCEEEELENNEFLKLVSWLAGKFDAVVATPHFSCIYLTEIRQIEKDFANAIKDAGALVVAGAHPHVLQPWELHAHDGKVIFFSVGNLISSQATIPYSADERCPALTHRYWEQGLYSDRDGGLSKEECHHILKSNAIFYVGIQKVDNGAAKVSCLSYVELTWDADKGMILANLDKDSYAYTLFGHRRRLEITQDSFNHKVKCVPLSKHLR